jgi:hypothetical protein
MKVAISGVRRKSNLTSSFFRIHSCMSNTINPIILQNVSLKVGHNLPNNQLIAMKIKCNLCFGIRNLHAKYKKKHWNPKSIISLLITKEQNFINNDLIATTIKFDLCCNMKYEIITWLQYKHSYLKSFKVMLRKKSLKGTFLLKNWLQPKLNLSFDITYLHAKY